MVVVPTTPQRSRAAQLAVVAGSAGLAYLLVHDGSPGWGLVRLVLLVLAAVGVLRCLRHGQGRSAAAVGWAAGALLFAVGVGIAVPHLAKTGLTGVAPAGLLVLGGGVMLLAHGTSVLVRSVRGWQRPPVALGLLACLVVVVLSLGQAVAATNVPRTSVGSRDPGDLGLVHRDVEYRTSDGVRLSAWYVPSRNGSAVVLLHGAGSTRAAVLDHAAVLASHGYGVLLADARGHGESDGRAMDFGWYGDEDVTAAVSFLERQPDVTGGRIGVLGLSMGGEEAIGAAAADPRIQGVVAEGATNRVAEDKTWLSDEYGWRGTLQRGIDRLTYAAADLLTEASPPISLRAAAAAAAPRPLLLIAGAAEAEEEPAARHIAAGAPDTVAVWVAPDTGHTDALAQHPDEWEARVTSFLQSALRPDPASG
jgi:dienelactone hydrolase